MPGLHERLQIRAPVKPLLSLYGTEWRERGYGLSKDQANIRQKLGLVWVNRKKMSQIIKDYFYIPFFLLVILWI
jgi:hypothetical protein